MARLGEALEIYLECQGIRDPAEVERRIGDRPDLAYLVLAMLGATQGQSDRGDPALGRGSVPADDPPPA